MDLQMRHLNATRNLPLQKKAEDEAFAALSSELAAKKVIFAGLERLTQEREKTELFHFPLCVLPPGLRPLARASLGQNECRRTPACLKCAAVGKCPGIPATYFLQNPPDEFSPLSKKEAAAVKIKK